MTDLTQADLANVAKLLERLRTGELNVIPGNHTPKPDESTAMLERVESFLSAGIRRMDAPDDDGGPAFPTHPPTLTDMNRRLHGASGMPLRDYFAAKAMQGLIASPRGLATGRPTIEPSEYAEVAYAHADAMLKARAQ